jgi:glyoxylase-like metal-dependent hydrolase (beta-lactamase superfamily II)
VVSVELVPGIFHLQGVSNMGLVTQDGKGLLIDTGLDEDAARQAMRAAAALDVTLEAVFLTHAHADHFGGAHLLQRRLGIPLVAPSLEAAMMEHPMLEPLFLFAGAAPISALRHKFTLAKPCRIDRVVEPGPVELGPFEGAVVSLPGHAPNQVGLAVGSTLFCADALFPAQTLEKHKVIFCVDLDETLETLARLPELPYERFAPGHGPAYNAGREIAGICDANRRRLEQVRELIHAALGEPQSTADLVQCVADHLGLHLTTATSVFLTRTTVLAALSSLERAGMSSAIVQENRLLWQRP